MYLICLLMRFFGFLEVVLDGVPRLRGAPRHSVGNLWALRGVSAAYPRHSVGNLWALRGRSVGALRRSVDTPRSIRGCSVGNLWTLRGRSVDTPRMLRG